VYDERALTEQLGISQSTCSHHVGMLADVGFVRLRKDRTATLVSVNPACGTGLRYAADAVMGVLGPGRAAQRLSPPT
jgi:DNA-binding transcriptional ArsR family regulator